jgi:hypothetical protein
MRSMNVWAWAPTGTGAVARRDRPAGRRRAGRVAGAAISALLASALVPGVVAPASAEVDWTGPVAANGFPAFYDDGNVKLKLCQDGLAAGCLAGPSDLEAFWFSATATNATAGGNLISYEASLGGTYENGVVVLPGDEVGFNRLRFKLDNLVAGATYTITHPYGVNTLLADPRGRIDTTIEGVCAPEAGFTCDWNAVGRGFLGDFALGTMTTFVKQVDAPAGRLGDINSPSAVTGAHLGPTRSS